MRSDDSAAPLPGVMTSPLPASWRKPALQASLSADGQLYLRCSACGAESRVAIIDVADTLAAPIEGPCSACGAAGTLAPIEHALRLSLRCRDCGAPARVACPWGRQPACPACASANVEVLDAQISPPIPANVYQLASRLAPIARLRADEPFVWGRSGVADAQQINDESRWLNMLPDALRYRSLLLSFADRLRRDHPDRSAEGRYWMENIVANLCQDLLRRTGELEFGVRGLASFGEMVGLAADPLNKALAQHSFAMGCFSLLAVAGEDVLVKFYGDPDFRLRAAAIADDAAQTFADAAKQGMQGASEQLARIHFVIGDLLCNGNADDAQRRTALDYFRAALKDARFRQTQAFGAAQSFAHAVLTLAEPTDEEIAEAAALLEPTLALEVSDLQHANAWRGQSMMSRLLRRQGEWGKAFDAAQRAASQALQQFSAITDERLLLQEAETFAHVFEDVACNLAAQGAKDDALNAVELSRAATVRIYTMGEAERDAHIKEIQQRQIEDLVPTGVREFWGDTLGRASERDFVGFLWDNPIDGAADCVLGRFGAQPSAYLSIFISDEVATGFVWGRAANGRHTLDVAQWVPDAKRMDWLSQQRYLDPGAFRERLMNKAADAVLDLFLAPLLPALDALSPRHLTISLPGLYSRMPFEAALARAGAQYAEIALSYLPSLRVGADIWQAAGASRKSPQDFKVLLVGYGGDDMSHLAEEEAGLRTLWGDRLTVLDGSTCTKRSVLDALRQPYDIIHAMCHGTYDAARPMNAALHFRPDADNDAYRISAADLLTLGWWPQRPVVILSACSSGLVADHRTSSFHGLPGSLFRIGARAIVGSRWPVDDALTARLMCKLHAELSRDEGPLDAMLQRAVRGMGDSLPIEQSAAFGVFGMA